MLAGFREKIVFTVPLPLAYFYSKSGPGRPLSAPIPRASFIDFLGKLGMENVSIL